MKCKKGFKLKDGKCVKSGSLLKKIKKSYNPLKMWGAWVGLVIIYPIVSFSKINIDPLSWFFQPIIRTISFSDTIEIILPAVSGFLIGWGVHSLIRRIKR